LNNWKGKIMYRKMMAITMTALWLSGCGVETAVTVGVTAEMEAAAAKEAVKQKEILEKQIQEINALQQQQYQHTLGEAPAASEE
jgi:hypothetical protein